jgi:hypothetical protein
VFILAHRTGRGLGMLRESSRRAAATGEEGDKVPTVYPSSCSECIQRSGDAAGNAVRDNASDRRTSTLGAYWLQGQPSGRRGVRFLNELA